jgi:hypothetical protein
MNKKTHIKIALFCGLFFPQTVFANCFNGNIESRLSNFCLIANAHGHTIDVPTAARIDFNLKREGYSRGLGFPIVVEQTSVETYVSPVLDYNNNINAGNPNRPLVLGNLSFDGDPANLLKTGVVAGLSTGFNGRHIYGNGRYLDFGVSASYAHSPNHKMGIARATANVCSRNDIGKHWYVDACGDSTRLVRDLAAETTSGLTISTTKLFATNGSSFHSANLGVRRHFAETYEHKQLLLGLQTARSNGIYTAFNGALGEAVENQLVLRHSIQATVGTSLFEKPLTATLSYAYSDGGMLLGFERNDTSRSISVSYEVTPKVSVNIGYRQTKSTIDYFNTNEPTVSVQLAPIRF